MKTTLVTCLLCGQKNFTPRGLRAHWCPAKPAPKGNAKHSAPLTRDEWERCCAAVIEIVPVRPIGHIKTTRREMLKALDAWRDAITDSFPGEKIPRPAVIELFNIAHVRRLVAVAPDQLLA